MSTDPTPDRATIVCPTCKGHPKRPSTRTEGGSLSCRHCNRTLTFNLMRDQETGGTPDCTCKAARNEACPTCGGDGEVVEANPWDVRIEKPGESGYGEVQVWRDGIKVFDGVGRAALAEHADASLLAERDAEIAFLRALLDSPAPVDFMVAATTEARYQRSQRDDSWKSDADWFWLIGHLAGKALHRGEVDGIDKKLHRITTIAAAAANWHADALAMANDEAPADEPIIESLNDSVPADPLAALRAMPEWQALRVSIANLAWSEHIADYARTLVAAVGDRLEPTEEHGPESVR